MLNLALQHDDVGIYQPRNPNASGYYRCVQDHFEQLEMHWQECYAPRYGFWRSYVTDVVYRYLECGDKAFWLCTGTLPSVRSRIFAGLFMQAASFLPFLPSIEGGGVC